MATAASLSVTVTVADEFDPTVYPVPELTCTVTSLSGSSSVSLVVPSVIVTVPSLAANTALVGRYPSSMSPVSLMSNATVSEAFPAGARVRRNLTAVPSVTELDRAAIVTVGPGSALSVVPLFVADRGPVPSAFFAETR